MAMKALQMPTYIDNVRTWSYAYSSIATYTYCMALSDMHNYANIHQWHTIWHWTPCIWQYTLTTWYSTTCILSIRVPFTLWVVHDSWYCVNSLACFENWTSESKSTPYVIGTACKFMHEINKHFTVLIGPIVITWNNWSAAFLSASRVTLRPVQNSWAGEKLWQELRGWWIYAVQKWSKLHCNRGRYTWCKAYKWTTL